MQDGEGLLHLRCQGPKGWAAALSEQGTRGEMVCHFLRGLVAVWFSLLCPFNGGFGFHGRKHSTAADTSTGLILQPWLCLPTTQRT